MSKEGWVRMGKPDKGLLDALRKIQAKVKRTKAYYDYVRLLRCGKS